MKRSGLFLLMLLGLAILVAFASAPAMAAINDEEELARFGSAGSGAGELQSPVGVATDPITGHVYVVEEFVNNRISEFTPWGEFVKAFGWDVSPEAVDEQQEVRIRASEGQFKLAFGASTTPDLAFNAPGAESEGPGSIEAALNALPSIGGAGGEVNVQAVPGTPDGGTPFIYVVVFKGSSVATNVDQLIVSDGTESLSGGVPSTSLEVRTRVDGHAATTGFEVCTAESGCKAGLDGGGSGQLDRPRGVAVDTNGNLYVREANNHRVQKFDSAGRFVWTAGGEVNKTTSANLCTAASDDECGTGVVGAGPSQFGPGHSGGIANCSGNLFVTDKDRIQRLNLQGEFEAELPVPGEAVINVACDPLSSSLYAIFEEEMNVHKLDTNTGQKVSEIEVESPFFAIATDLTGNLFAGGRLVIDEGSEPNVSQVVFEFGPIGKPLTPPHCCKAASFAPLGLGFNPVGTLYVSYSSADSFIRSFGPGPVTFEAAPKVPPSITAQFAGSVGRDDATVGAEINPHFWSDTTYQVEYGTGKCSEGGCTETKPVPAAILSSKTVDAPLKSAGIFLEGLEPGTTYHYRFVTQSTGGGPVYGIDPDGEGSEGATPEEGLEGAFTTFPVPTPPKTDCPTQAFRTGASAPLPDCRAYEMVSPLDKNNGDIRALLDLPAFSTAFNQSATDGSRFTYTSYRGFADPLAAPYTNQYLATREGEVGWSSESLDLAQASRFSADAFENHSKAFTADLCRSWLMVLADPPPVPEASAGYRNIYQRENCGGGGLKALIGVEPTAKAVYPVLQGASADGEATVLLARDKLTDDAIGGGTWQAYYASEGQLRLLCVLPSGLPSGGSCSAGTLSPGPTLDRLERLSSLTHAISDDGSRVYLTDAEGKPTGGGGQPPGGPGKVYLRLNPGEEQSEVLGDECTEPEKACTVEVSETATTKTARFLRASADGSKAIFEVAEGAQQGSLFLFDLEAEDSTLIAAKGLGVASASENLSRIYFVSEEALPETSGAIAGKANLYLDQEGTKSFVATMSSTEDNTSPEPIYHVARATPDGRVLAFVSTESLTGYDNNDLITGKADSEVYLYEVGSAEPVCISCNPSGARPVGREKTAGNSSTTTPTAAFLPLPDNALYTPRVLSNDGQQLFFNSFDTLLPRDTNGKTDVYQWQKAQDQKACDKAGAELYVPSSDGCISLISTGQSPQDSELLDISANGQDAFFTTNASLLPQDPGLVDVYDARANGGLPIPPEPPGPCQGEACQRATAPPNDPTPASASFRGAGNPSAKPRPRCAKGKTRRKGRCVAKREGARKAAQRKQAKHDRKVNR